MQKLTYIRARYIGLQKGNEPSRDLPLFNLEQTLNINDVPAYPIHTTLSLQTIVRTGHYPLELPLASVGQSVYIGTIGD